MDMHTTFRGIATAALIGGAGLALGGCLGAPTYGTDKTATEQLFDDIGNMVSLPSTSNNAVNYAPRPDLVQPPREGAADLPPPQESVASRDNPQWLESPEETRERLIAEIDENSDRADFRSPLGGRVATNLERDEVISPRGRDEGLEPRSARRTAAEQRAAYQRSRQTQQGTYTGRRYLSDPPPGYKQPSETAPVGDLGTPERTKERERLAAAKKQNSGGRRWWPF